MLTLMRGMVGPLLACAPMAAAVIGVRFLFERAELGASVWSLGAELLAGAVAYVAFAFVFATATARDFLGLLFGVLRRGRDDDD
jgi:PST family polysaccharide transporter